jgi:CheY-like chemotaxis protein
VLENLLDNAFKYTGVHGSIRVSVGCAEGRAVLAVSDDGRGINKEALPHVFEPFFQVEDGERAGAAGLGLGLAMVENITRLHGGSVEARSAGAGRGAMFEVRLPLASGSASGEVEPARPVPRLRLLVIEDDTELAEVFATLLASLGHEAHVVHDGRGGADTVARLRPDMVFVDLGLPDIDGREVARRVRRELGRAAPAIVALTGFPQEGSNEGLFDDYLLKPVARARVEQVFRNLAPRRTDSLDS